MVGLNNRGVGLMGPGRSRDLSKRAARTANGASCDASSDILRGWTRRFVLEVRGWCNDMGLYAKDGDTVEPLPGTSGPAATRLQARCTTRCESGR